VIDVVDEASEGDDGKPSSLDTIVDQESKAIEGEDPDPQTKAKAEEEKAKLNESETEEKPKRGRPRKMAEPMKSGDIPF
jgi:hypothetical protein